MAVKGKKKVDTKTESKYFQSKEFKDQMTKIINSNTWDKGLPKYYMDKEGWLVEHWKDGEIVKIKNLKQ